MEEIFKFKNVEYLGSTSMIISNLEAVHYRTES